MTTNIAPAGGSEASRGRVILASFLLLLGGATYSIVPSFNRIAADAGIPPLAYVFWQALGAGSVLLVLCAFRRKLPALSRLHLRYYVVMGSIGFGVPYCLMVALAPRIPVGIMALALALVPILTYTLSLALSMERFRALRVAGILLGLGGMLFILLPETSLPEPGMAVWAALALVPPVMFAASLVAAERFYPEGADSLALACGVLLLTAVYLFPVMLATGGVWLFAAPFDAADGVVVGSALVVALAWICLVEVIRLAGAVFYSTVAYIESLCGVGFGMLIFGERHSPWVWAAAALLMAGLFLVNRTGLRPGTAPV